MEDYIQRCSEVYHGTESETSEEKFTKVFVRSVGGALNAEYLKTWFEKNCNGVKCVEVAKDRFGKTLDFGYVDFYTHRDAMAAVRNSQIKMLRDIRVEVEALKTPKDCDEKSNRNVFVKGFGPTWDKKRLRVYFRDNVGDVESVNVATDENGISRGYGHVSFYECKDAAKAVREINGKKVDGKALTVEFFIPREERSPDFNCNVYVNGFDEVLDDEDLKQLFEIFGEIQSSKVERDADGTSKCYGYVCFRKWQEAQIAMHYMNGYKMGSNVLTVQLFRSKEERKRDLRNRNLHIKDLHESVDVEELMNIFQPYGKILRAGVRPCPYRGKSQGFVCFETADQADDAIAAVDRQLYKGFRLQVTVHHHKESQFDGTKDIHSVPMKIERDRRSAFSKPPRAQGNYKNLLKSKSDRNLNADTTKRQSHNSYRQFGATSDVPNSKKNLHTSDKDTRRQNQECSGTPSGPNDRTNIRKFDKDFNVSDTERRNWEYPEFSGPTRVPNVQKSFHMSYRDLNSTRRQNQAYSERSATQYDPNYRNNPYKFERSRTPHFPNGDRKNLYQSERLGTPRSPSGDRKNPHESERSGTPRFPSGDRKNRYESERSETPSFTNGDRKNRYESEHSGTPRFPSGDKNNLYGSEHSGTPHFPHDDVEDLHRFDSDFSVGATQRQNHDYPELLERSSVTSPKKNLHKSDRDENITATKRQNEGLRNTRLSPNAKNLHSSTSLGCSTSRIAANFTRNLTGNNYTNECSDEERTLEESKAYTFVRDPNKARCMSGPSNLRRDQTRDHEKFSNKDIRAEWGAP